MVYLECLPGVRSGAGRAENMSCGSPFMDRCRLRAFSRDPLIKRGGGGITQLKQKPAKNNDKAANMGHCRLKGCLFKLGMADHS